MNILNVLVILLLCFINATRGNNYYEILGISKDATVKDIRKAFKEKALVFHPDKNKDDSDAHEKFLLINRAYEVLKDDELRKVYDQYGEEGLDPKARKNQFYSWTYYHDNFGIYDDDPEVITLSKQDFVRDVKDSEITWFINYYHPMCSHCHMLAPTWRKVAKELEGIVRIGAVNCDDDYQLCSSEGIRSYPSLITYPYKVKFSGSRESKELVKFILSLASKDLHVLEINSKNILHLQHNSSHLSLLLIVFSNNEAFLEFQTDKMKLLIILKGLVEVGVTKCYEDEVFCKEIALHPGVYYFDKWEIVNGKGVSLSFMEPKEICKELLKQLPSLKLINYHEYEVLRKNLLEGSENKMWLIKFEGETDDDLEHKKLPKYLSSFSLARVKCSEMSHACDELFISKLPSFVFFKPGGGYEIYQGRLFAYDIAQFAFEAARAPRFRVLTPREFPTVLQNGSPWFIDFYVPWCSPCLNLLLEFHKASQLVSDPVNFGIIDCSVHNKVCLKYNINRYPISLFYNQSVPHEYFGFHYASDIVLFVKDVLYPVVKHLNSENFQEQIIKKKTNETWVVNYFASWCHYCKNMAPEYRKFARDVISLKYVFIAEIDCAIFKSFCENEGVRAYPTIKLYPTGVFGNKHSMEYTKQSKDAISFKSWLYEYLPSRTKLLNEELFDSVLKSNEPWLIDFYAPWCSHCHVFAPVFEEVAEVLKYSVQFGKINCEIDRYSCQRAGIRAYPSVVLYPGKHHGRKQSVSGLRIDNLQKEHIIKFVQNYVPSKKIVHDEF